jgi:WD40 repeat protein
MARLPYPGLRAFRNDETDLFFGREGVVDTLVERLGATRFLAVLGASGSGKSSVVRTGLIDALEMGFLASAGSRWRILDFSPGGRPHRNLALTLAGPDADDMEVDLLESFLMRGPRSLVEWCENGNLAKGTNLLVLVDQFEELFRYRSYAGREEAEAFVSLILESAKADSVPVYVALTMRSEYLGACTLIEGLAEAINRGQYLTPRLTRDETRRAIAGPAGVCDFVVSQGLVTRLLNDLDSFAPWEEGDGVDQLNRLVRRADQLPLLQHALNRMYTLARNEPGGREPLVLTVADYERIGALKGTLDGQASEILEELGEERLPIVEGIFRALTTGTTIADAVRRPTPFRELVDITGGRREDVLAVVRAFSDQSRNLLQAKTAGDIEDDTVIDISHESLIRQWSLLSDWLRKEAEAVGAWRRLQEAAALHSSGRGNLLEDLNLANVAEWWDREMPSPAWAKRYGGRYDEVSAFLAQSREHDRVQRERHAALEREAQEAKLREAEHQRMIETERANASRLLQRRTLAIASILAVVAVFAIAAGVIGWFNYVRADEAQRQAVAAAQAAEQSERLAAQSASDRELALASAQTAASLYRIYEARGLIARALVTLGTDQESGRRQLSLPLQLILSSLPSEASPDPRLLDLAITELRRIVQGFATGEPSAEAEILEPPGLQLAHTNEVNGVDVSPDETLIATASEDGTVRIWARDTGETLRTLTFDGSGVSTAEFSPDGTLLAIGGADNKGHIVEVETGTEIATLEGHTARVRSIAWAPDGTRVVTASDDGTARLWTLAGEISAVLQGHTDYVRSVAFAPDGQTIATSSDDRSVRLWSAADGTEIRSFLGHSDWVRSVAFSPDGQRLASGSDDGRIRIWSIQTGREVRNIKAADQNYIFAVRFSPDGTLLASGATDSLVRLWSADTGASVRDIEGHGDTVYSLAFSANGEDIFSASADFTAREWSVATGELELTLGGRPPDIASLAFGDGGGRIVTGSGDGTVRVWSVADHSIVHTETGSARIMAVAQDPSGDTFAAASDDNLVRIWSGDGTLLQTLAQDDWTRSLAFSPDGTLLAAGSDDKNVYVWEVATGELVNTFIGHRDWLRSVAFSPDGDEVLSGSDDGTARLWSLATGEQVRLFEGGHTGYVYAVAFSPDGETIATGGDDYAVQIWSARTGAQGRRINLGDGVVNGIAFSPGNGNDILTTSGSGTVRIWSLESGSEFRSFQPDVTAGITYYSAGYAQDGSAIAIGGSDGRLRLYSLFDTENVLQRGFEILETLDPLDQRQRCDYLIDLTAAQCDGADAAGAATTPPTQAAARAP